MAKRRRRPLRRLKLIVWCGLIGVLGWGFLTAKADEKPIQPSLKEIEAQFEKLAKAIRARNLSALSQLLTPDFKQKNLDGQISDRKAAQKNFADALKAMKSLSAGFTVEKTFPGKGGIEVMGLYLFSGMTTPKAGGGKSQQLAMSLPIKTLWAKTKTGWKLKRMEQQKGGVVKLDGKTPGE